MVLSASHTYLFFAVSPISQKFVINNPQSVSSSHAYHDIHPRKGWVDEQEVWYHYFVSTDYMGDKIKRSYERL